MERRRCFALVTLGGCAAAFALWWPAFRDLHATGFWDWQFFLHMWEAGWVAVTRFGEWPLWDPYHCGGITIFGNPQSQHLSPLYWVSFLVEPNIAMKIFLVAHATAGFGGMYWFARREYALGRTGAATVSAIWAGSGFFAWHGAWGHSAFLPFYLTPILLIAWRAAARDLRHCASVAALMTLVLLEGGVYPFPYFVLLLGFDAATRFAPGEGRPIALAAAVSGGLTILAGAVRALPVIDELARNPRIKESTDWISLSELLEMLTARSHGWSFGDHEFLWPEYGTFVGWGALALASIGAWLAWRGGRRTTLLGLAFFGSLMLGEYGPWSPWSLLHRLPIYDSLRVPARFAVFFTFYLALLAGLCVERVPLAVRALRGRVPEPWLGRVARALPVVLLVAIAGDLWIVNTRTTDRWHNPPLEIPEVAERFHLTREYGQTWYARLPRMGMGTKHCYEAMNFTVARGLWSGDRPQAVIEGARGEVHDWGRTTSTAFAVVTLESPGRVVFNQNHAPGWTSSVGRAGADASGRLVVDIGDPGRHRVDLRYRPPTLVPGATLSALGGVACLWVAARPRRGMMERI